MSSARPAQNPRDALRRIIEANHAALVRLCRHYEADSERRRDLYQEVVLACWQALPSFRGDASERTWFFRIAHNVAITWVTRAARRRGVNTVADDGGEPRPRADASFERRLEHRAELNWLSAAIDRLPLAEQQLILLHLEGLSAPEIAAVTELSQTNVRTKLSRIKGALMQERRRSA